MKVAATPQFPTGPEKALATDVPFTYPDASRQEMLDFVPAEAQRLLDVGCAGGQFGATLKAVRPVIVEGVEAEGSSAQRAAKCLDAVYEGYFPKALPPQVGFYDCVVFNDVLEHVLEPSVLLEAASQLLAPAGKLVISVPNVRYAPVVLGLLVRGRWDYQDQGVLDRTHVRFFTRRSLLRLLADADLDVERVSRINVPGSRRVPLLSRLVQAFLRDLSCPQFALVASPRASAIEPT